MKKINLCSAITLMIFTIYFLHHRHLHAITGTFSYLLKNTASSGKYIFGIEALHFVNLPRCIDSYAGKPH